VSFSQGGKAFVLPAQQKRFVNPDCRDVEGSFGRYSISALPASVFAAIVVVDSLGDFSTLRPASWLSHFNTPVVGLGT
jgi:hypothetical protein